MLRPLAIGLCALAIAVQGCGDDDGTAADDDVGTVESVCALGAKALSLVVGSHFENVGAVLNIADPAIQKACVEMFTWGGSPDGPLSFTLLTPLGPMPQNLTFEQLDVSLLSVPTSDTTDVEEFKHTHACYLTYYDVEFLFNMCVDRFIEP